MIQWLLVVGVLIYMTRESLDCRSLSQDHVELLNITLTDKCQRKAHVGYDRLPVCLDWIPHAPVLYSIGQVDYTPFLQLYEHAHLWIFTNEDKELGRLHVKGLKSDIEEEMTLNGHNAVHLLAIKHNAFQHVEKWLKQEWLQHTQIQQLVLFLEFSSVWSHLEQERHLMEQLSYYGYKVFDYQVDPRSDFFFYKNKRHRKRMVAAFLNTGYKP